MEHLIALVSCSLVCILLFLSFYGLGCGTCMLVSPDLELPSILKIWIGLAIYLLALQLVHLITPITALAVIPIVVIGSSLAVMQFAKVFKQSRKLSLSSDNGLLILALAVSSLWLFSKSMQPPLDYDSGLYHFQSIRWANEYPIVPGLGNLHGRLAFNQSFFLYIASINTLGIPGYVLGNASIALLVLGTILSCLVSWNSQCWIVRYTALCTLLPLYYFCTKIRGINSPSPDIAIALLQLGLILLLANTLNKSARTKDYGLILLLMSATLVTIKLSSLAFAMAMTLYVIITCWNRAWMRPSINFCIGIAVVWMGRNIILSGAPIYPSTFLLMPLDWSMPAEGIHQQAEWAYAWARNPSNPVSETLANWAWFDSWLNARKVAMHEFLYPITLSFLSGLALILIAVLWKNSRPLNWRQLAFIAIPIISLAFWFFTAPAVRFSSGIIFMLPVTITAVIAGATTSLKRKPHIILFVLLFTLVNFKLINILKINLESGWLYYGISHEGWASLPVSKVESLQLSDGTPVFVPLEGDQCWDCLLPCTPYIDDNVILRDPENIGAGFKVVEKSI